MRRVQETGGNRLQAITSVGSSAEASACEALDGCDSGSAPEPLLPAQPPSARPGIVAFAMRTGERPDPHASDAPIARAIAASATAGSSALTAEMPQPSAAGTPLTAAAAPPGLVLVTAAVARATAVALSPAAGLAAKVADAAPAPLPGLVLSALEQVPKLVSPAAEGWLVWGGLLGGAAARVASDALACVAAAVVGASVVGAMQ
ncbi:hypothetical protein FNF29_05723 [Cafeteria roenbergensis]|nr:hypothetical protein FNF29_05723 [Cafeteria roenbergensis]|eukprot:KAA0149712.1 hypothetical protein FNF29_05723 [Cafeteria roenbergensis]